jgi:hypothetical protein
VGSLDDIQRAFFDWLYTNRIPVALGSIVLAVAVLAIAWRAGWFAAARRHPRRSGASLLVAIAIALPVTWYLASPIWIRTELIEPEAATEAVAAASPRLPSSAGADPSRPVAPVAASPTVSPTPAATPLLPRTTAIGEFHGTDDFHFGRGTARIVETAPGRFTLRLTDFSVRNGPDLFVYLSPSATEYDDGALELGRLKATDGSFGYDLPPGSDPADFASAIIWCKQFSHLFAVASLSAG